MSVAKIKKKLIGLSVWVFLVASIVTILPTTPTYAASNPALVKESCRGAVGSYATNYQSPFISGECLGQDSQSSETATTRQFYQFVVTFDNPVKSATVTGKNANGDNIKFLRDTKTGDYVSLPDTSTGNAYNVPIGVSPTTCKPNKFTSITINVSANGTTQPPFSAELCNNIGDSKSLLYFDADQITGDGGVTSTKGAIIGLLGVKRENTSIPTLKQAPAQKIGVVSLKLTGVTADGKAITPITGDVNSPDSVYSLAGGNFRMPVAAGTYDLEIVYDDGTVILTQSGGDPSMTSRNIDFKWTGIKVPPGGDACVTNNNLPVCSSVYYISSNVTTTNTPGTPSATTCDSTGIEGIAWLICPIMNALGGLDDAMYGWVSSVLQLNPLEQTDSKGLATPQYQNWVIIRNIANVVLVIGFLAIIFSQITSIGISNYGVKKMLPRVILVAIAINLSWFIMASAVDVVNILGVGLHTLLSATGVNASIDTLNISNVTAALTGGTLATAGVAGLTAAVIIPATFTSFGTLILLALPFILGAALALLAAVATLFVRNALVIVLVIIAPLAIAAYLLPNTEEYFKKWRKLLISMLLLFPVAAVLFAGCKFAAYVVLTSNQPFNVIVAIFIMAAPLGLLPWLARSTGGIMETVNKRLGSAAKGSQNALRKGFEGRIAAQRSEQKSSTRGFWGNTIKKNIPIAGTGDRYRKTKNGHTKGDLKRDANDNEINQQMRGKTTLAGRWGNRGQGLKEREGNAQKVIVSNYKQIGLGGTGASARQQRNVASIIDAGKTADLQTKAIDAQYEARLGSRQLDRGSAENYLTKQQEDAEAHSKEFQGRLKQEQAERIRDGAISTVAGAIGEGVSVSLRDVNRAEFAAEAGTKAAEDQTKRANKESGADEIYIAHQKEAEAGTKLVETQQEAEFTSRQAREAPLREVVEQQDRADRKIETTEAEKKASLEQKVRDDAAAGDTTLEELEKRKQEAEAHTELLHGQEAAELAARMSPTGGPLDADGNPTPGDLYVKYKKEQEDANLQKEIQEASQKSAYGARLSDAGDLQGAADEKAAIEETAAGGEARAKARIEAAKAGTGKAVPGMDPELQERLKQAGVQQAIGARQQALAQGVAGVVRAREITRQGRTGSLVNDMAGTGLGISDTTNVEFAKAGETILADLAGDTKAYRDSNRQDNRSSTDIYHETLGIENDRALDEGVDAFVVKTSDELPLAEEVASVEDIVQFGGADDNDRLFTYSSKLTKLAREAEEKPGYETAKGKKKEDRTPAEAKLVDDAEKARTRSRTIHSTLQRAWATNASQRPMQYGGSIEQYFANDTEERSRSEIMADRLGGGKYDSTIGTANIDRLKELESQIQRYRDDPGLLTREFTAAFEPTAKYKAGERIKKLYATPADLQAAVADGSFQAAVDAAAPAELKDLLTKEKYPGYGSFLLTLDEALDNPNSPVKLSPEKREKLKQTREVLMESLNNSRIPYPKVPKLDPATNQPSLDSEGNPILGDYRRRAAGEYNPQT